MPPDPTTRDATWIVFGGAVIAMATPLVSAVSGLGWLGPFVLWFGVILLARWLGKRWDRDD